MRKRPPKLGDLCTSPLDVSSATESVHRVRGRTGSTSSSGLTDALRRDEDAHTLNSLDSRAGAETAAPGQLFNTPSGVAPNQALA